MTNPQSYFPGIEGAIYNMLLKVTGATGVFFQQASVPVDITAIAASETNVLDLSDPNTVYCLNSMVLKSGDPSPNTVDVRLYKEVNGVLTAIKKYSISSSDYQTYFDLESLFGEPHMANGSIKITVQASAGGPYAVTGQYQYGKTNV